MARSFLGKLKRGLFMTHTEFLERAGETFRRTGPVEPAVLDSLEEALIASDAGVDLSLRLVDELREEVRGGRITTAEELRPAVRARLLDLLRRPRPHNRCLHTRPGPGSPCWSGSTGPARRRPPPNSQNVRRRPGRRSSSPLPTPFVRRRSTSSWCGPRRVGAPVIHQQEGADPAAVVFDAIAAARSRGIDEVLVDTAGRLHNRANLMKELEKVTRIAAREVAGAPHEVLLVLDATTGANGIEQAQKFGATAGVTGVVLTKLDGTAKGGVILAIADRLQLPVRWVGVGEAEDDLLPFRAAEFVDSLLDINPGDTPKTV